MYDTILVYQDIGILHDAMRLYKTYDDDDLFPSFRG